MVEIYKSPLIKDLQTYYGELLYPEVGTSILTYLQRIAGKLWEAIQNDLAFARMEISNYDPHYAGRAANVLPMQSMTLEDAYRTVACQYGFESWQNVENLGMLTLDTDFEKAVNLLLAGAETGLKEVLERRPTLVHSRSQFGHQATLLHYAASNGVEIWRQVVPLNLTQMVRLLLEKGASKQATMRVYGGHFDTLSLLKSSCHPYDAGIGLELEKALNR